MSAHRRAPALDVDRLLTDRKTRIVGTLTCEHAMLLDHVAALVADVFAIAAEDRWPRRELYALLGYLDGEVVRQLGDEERLLFTGRPTPPGFNRLRRDHLRLRHCAEALAGAARGESGWSAARVATTSRDLLTMLERHLATEDALLGATTSVRSSDA